MHVLDLDDLHWPGEASLRAHASVALRAKLRRDDATLREMLGRWVSESEPSVAFGLDTGEIIGLTRADDPTGMIVLTPAT